MSKKNPPAITNKKAKFEFAFEEQFEAGIQLTGAEVKSLREGRGSLQEAFCYFKKDELYIKNFHIAEYKFETVAEQNPTRERKLLLKSRELKKLRKGVSEKGYTIVPYKSYFNARGFVKISIHLAKGKKIYDKRDTMRDRDNKRQLDRIKNVRFS